MTLIVFVQTVRRMKRDGRKVATGGGLQKCGIVQMARAPVGQSSTHNCTGMAEGCPLGKL